MSTTASAVERNSKFTRGEKCLFLHLVITFCLIIAIVIGYYGHACLVRHRGNLGVSLRRSGSGASDGLGKTNPEYRCVGAVYVTDGARDHVACASALLTPMWSLAPARCVTARSRPALAHLLPYWTLRYDTNSTAIRRGIPHPSFDSDDAANDLGLFEHEKDITLETPFCTVPTKVISEDLSSEEDLHIIVWHYGDGWSATHAQGVPSEQCAQFTGPLVERRTLCVSVHPGLYASDTTLTNSVLFSRLQMVALASWGNGVDGFPLVVVDIAQYQEWLNLTI